MNTASPYIKQPTKPLNTETFRPPVKASQYAPHDSALQAAALQKLCHLFDPCAWVWNLGSIYRTFWLRVYPKPSTPKHENPQTLTPMRDSLQNLGLLALGMCGLLKVTLWLLQGLLVPGPKSRTTV